MIYLIQKGKFEMGNLLDKIGATIIGIVKAITLGLKELVSRLGRFFGKLVNWFRKGINFVEQRLASLGLNAEVSGAQTFLNRTNEGFQRVSYEYSKQGDEYRRDTVIEQKFVDPSEIPSDILLLADNMGLNNAYINISAQTSEKILSLQQ